MISGKTGRKALHGQISSRRGNRITSAVIESLENRRLLSGISFQAVTSYALINPTLGSGSGPTVVADFNGDGHVDAAAIVGGKLGIAFGNADGTFQTPSATPVASGLYYPILATAHIGGDGVDLVAPLQDVYSSANKKHYDYLEAFVNSGNGTFVAKTILLSKSNYADFPLSITAGNFGGDRLPGAGLLRPHH